MINHNKVLLKKINFNKIKKIIKIGSVVSGKEVYNLEKKACSFFNHKYAVAVSSGFSALRLALSSIRKSNKKMIVGLPAYSCVAIPNAVVNLNMTLKPYDLLKGKFLPDLKKKYLDKLDAIIFVNTFGNNMTPNKFRFKNINVIEDFTHGFTKTSCHKKSKSLKIISLHATKLISSFEGGIILTNNKKQYEFLKFNRYYADKELSPSRQNDLMSEVEAAVASDSLSNINFNIRFRKKMFNNYLNFLKKKVDKKVYKSLITVNQNRDIFYRFILSCKNISEIKKKFLKKGIKAEYPISPWVKNLKKFPVSKFYFENFLSLPFHLSLKTKDIKSVVNEISKINHENFN